MIKRAKDLLIETKNFDNVADNGAKMENNGSYLYGQLTKDRLQQLNNQHKQRGPGFKGNQPRRWDTDFFS